MQEKNSAPPFINLFLKKLYPVCDKLKPLTASDFVTIYWYMDLIGAG